MPKHDTEFSDQWKQLKDKNGQVVGEWLEKGEKEGYANCKLCKKDFRIDNGGRSQVIQHADGAKHKHQILKQTKSNFKLKAPLLSTSSSSAAPPLLAMEKPFEEQVSIIVLLGNGSVLILFSVE